jgi:predicted CXXCH cytochrome family protein
MKLWAPLGGMAAAVLSTAVGLVAAGGPETPPPGPEAGFVGATRCLECHQAIHAKWKGGRHSRMVQPATAESVRGDFTRGRLELRGLTYTLRAKDGGYFIGESYVTGRHQERRVDYTLGNRRVQHYLTTLADGRIVVLPPSWDVQRGQWFHNLEIVDPDETHQTRLQVWNTNCVGCHVSQQDKNYDPLTKTYATRWADFGTSCERCHGPGRGHLERFEGGAKGPAGPAVVRPSRLTPAKSSMVCAQCHSLRDVTVPGFVAGADYYDHFTPILEYGQKAGSDPAYWPDGRPRRFSNDALGLWQSACFLRGGATCTTCHRDPHEPDVDRNPQLRQNELCLGCHASLAPDPAAHTRHRADSRGSSCVECHMPETVVSLKSRMRDHAIGVPVPENTVRFGIPNACNQCHTDRDARWAARAIVAWGPGEARRKAVRRAEAFTAGRRGDPAAVPALAALAADPAEGPLARANAVGHLRRFGNDPRLLPVLEGALRADPPLVRAVAALTLAEVAAPAERVKAALVAALGDSSRIVRVGAAFSLASRGVTRLAGDDGARLAAAREDYVRRAELLNDDPRTQLEVGKFFLVDGSFARAAQALEATLQLEATTPGARYFLALARLGQGEADEGRRELERVPAADPFSQPARAMLARLPRR